MQATKQAEGSVFKLANQVSQLKRLVDQLGSPKDTSDLRQVCGCPFLGRTTSSPSRSPYTTLRCLCLCILLPPPYLPGPPPVPPAAHTGGQRYHTEPG